MISFTTIELPPLRNTRGDSLSRAGSVVRGSAALEVRLALLLECGDPFFGVSRDEHSTNRFTLDGRGHIEWRTVTKSHRELGMTDRNAWSGRKLRRVLDRGCAARRGIRKQLVHDAQI